MENLLIDNMLENAKIGIWVIELSHNKKNDPKMFGNTHMKLLLGVADSYSPEEVYQFWVERIHPAYVSYVEEAVERLISGNKAEVEYPWKHPENGWMYIRCGGYLNTNFTQCYRLEGYHQDISNLIFRLNHSHLIIKFKINFYLKNIHAIIWIYTMNYVKLIRLRIRWRLFFNEKINIYPYFRELIFLNL